MQEEPFSVSNEMDRAMVGKYLIGQSNEGGQFSIEMFVRGFFEMIGEYVVWSSEELEVIASNLAANISDNKEDLFDMLTMKLGDDQHDEIPLLDLKIIFQTLKIREPEFDFLVMSLFKISNDVTKLPVSEIFIQYLDEEENDIYYSEAS